MQSTKLISMCAFILLQRERYKNDEISWELCVKLIFEYCLFLMLPLELKHFIPCDEGGKPLEKPEHYDVWKAISLFTKISEMDQNLMLSKYLNYEQALSEVIFEGISKVQAEHFILAHCRTIESTIVKFDLNLTPSKAKSLELID